MKALVYTKPRRLEFKTWPDPKLEPGDALVRVRGVAICGSDVHGWMGHSRGRVPPLVLGHEMSGVVEEVRDPASTVKPGDRVAVYPILGCERCDYCASGRDFLCHERRVLGLHMPGGFAEYLKAPAKNLYPLGESTGFNEGAMIEPVACALHSVGKCVQERGPIAILGAGPIGLLCLQVARQLNFPRIAVLELNPQRLEEARRQGAHLALRPGGAAALKQIDRFFGKEGCVAVYDAAGFTAARQLATRLVKTGGLIVSIGLGDQESPLDFVEIVRREIRIEGAFAYSRREFEVASEWIAADRLSLKSWISEAPLAQGQPVFEELARPDSGRIKVILKP